MKNSGLRLAVIFVALYAVFAGFIFTTVTDESSYPGAQQLRATGPAVSMNGQTLPEIMDQLAISADAVIVREVRDLHDPKVRHAYLSSSDSSRTESSWLADGYPSFSRSITTAIHPSRELTATDLRGEYYVFGSGRSADAVQSGLEKLGVQVEITGTGRILAQTLSWFFTGSVGATTIVVLLLLTMLVGVSVTSNVKFYSILKLNGMSKGQSIVLNYRSMVAFTVSIFALCIVAGSIGLFFYNRLSQYAEAARNFGIVLIAGLLFISLCHAISVNLVWSTNVLSGIKGKLGFQVAVPAAYLIRVPGLLLAVSLVTSSFVTGQQVLASQQTLRDLSQAGHVSTLLFEGNMPSAEVRGLANSSGKWLKEQDDRGKLIVAIPTSIGEASSESPNGLVVNNAYLGENKILNRHGERITEAPAGGAKILVLDGQQVSRDEFVYASLPANTSVETIASGQRHLLYEPQPSGDRRPATLTDVPVVVYGPGADLFSNDDFMDYASQGRILAKDYAAASDETPEKLLGSWIAAYIPVAQTAADDYATNVMELRLKIANSLIALLVLVSTAVGLAQIHVRGNAKTILVRYLHGWSFFASHKWLVISELALIGVALAWAVASSVYSYVSFRTTGASIGAEAELASLLTWQPVTLGVIAIFSFAVLFGAVAARTRSMIRKQSEETA